MSTDEDGPIILFNVFITVDKVTHRFVGFSHRILLKKIRTRSHFFFDGTFKVVPNMFDQLLNGMIWDEEEQTYIPLLWILMTGRTEFLYNYALNLIASAAGQARLSPLSITCDFELPLMNAFSKQFSLVNVNGCLFHLKQAVFKKCTSLAIDPS